MALATGRGWYAPPHGHVNAATGTAPPARRHRHAADQPARETPVPLYVQDVRFKRTPSGLAGSCLGNSALAGSGLGSSGLAGRRRATASHRWSGARTRRVGSGSVADGPRTGRGRWVVFG